MRRPAALVSAVLLAAAAMGTVGAAAPSDVVVYRCTDPRGRVTLRDTPCRKGETQQTRTMVRPLDPPPRAAPVRPAPAAAAPPPREIVYRTPPRPLYECVTPDGERYTADTDAGNPRWVPWWTLAWPVRHGHHPPHRRHDAPPPAVEPRHRHDPVYVYPAGTWVRDECHSLPQQEVCARLRDERYALDRRYFSALQGERDEITRRQRGIDARLAQDCGDP